MLILDRKRGQAVDLMNKDTKRVLATVRVLEICPDGVVRLGFDAGQEILIMRDNASERQRQQGMDIDGNRL